MKFKIKEKPKVIYENEYLIFPRKFKGYWYWLCWATIRYSWLGHRYQRTGEMIGEGKNVKQTQLFDEN